MPVPARLFVVPLLFAASMAQAIRVEGIVREATTRMPMRGAVVRMERTGLPVEVCTTRIDGHYRFELKAGQRGVISFACKDRLTRRLVFDASAVPREWTDALAANVDVRLFPPMAGVDPALLNAPIGMASWSDAEENMVWDVDRSDTLITRWNALLEEHLLAHPEQRPDDVTLLIAKLLELALRFPFIVAMLLGLLVWAALRWFLRSTSGKARAWGLGVVLLLCAWAVFELRNAGGPLRYLALLGVLLGIVVLFNLMVAMMQWRRHAAFGHAVPMDASEPWDDDDDDDDDDDELENEDEDEEVETDMTTHRAEVDAAQGWSVSRWWERNRYAVQLVVGMLLLVAEWRAGLENTLQVGPLVALGLVGGIVFAWAIATLRQRRAAGPVGLFAAGGVNWITLPMVMLAALSFGNRVAADEQETCETVPVVEVNAQRKDGPQIRVLIHGDHERLEMDRGLKEQLTTLDSLRCCVRNGALGFDFVERVEPVSTADDPV